MSEKSPLAKRPHTLYRMYDSARRLLYVGITFDASGRFRDHAEAKEWWPRIANIKVQHFPDRQSVSDAEIEAIKTERPKYNVQHRGETFIARVRIPIERWRRLELAAKHLGTDRAKLANQFVAWYAREPGATLPERPPRSVHDPAA